MRTKSWLALVLGLTLAACSSGGSSGSSSTPGVSGTITVSAAASLNQAFEKIGADFQHAHKGTTVDFNFDSSANLVTQIEAGAPADVFASADQDNMAKLTDTKRVSGSPAVFARNRLEIATKPANPRHVRTLADLSTVGIVALCAVTAPCGKYANQILSGAHVTIPTGKITRGQNATATLGAISQGDADAGIVYVTDVEAAGSAVTGVPIPDGENVIAVYPIGVLEGAKNAVTAKAFARYVASAPGERTLRSFGFLAP